MNICRYTYENFIYSEDLCEGYSDPVPVPDLLIDEIAIEHEGIVVRGCNYETPILEEITYSISITRGEEILHEETLTRGGGFGVGCETSTFRILLSTLDVVSGDTIEVTFIWDPDNTIEELNEDNNVASVSLIVP